MSKYVSKDVISADIIRALAQVYTQFCARSILILSDYFRLMFIDSKIAKNSNEQAVVKLKILRYHSMKVSTMCHKSAKWIFQFVLMQILN